MTLRTSDCGPDRSDEGRAKQWIARLARPYLVDAHAKSHSCDNTADLVHHEVGLRIAPVSRAQPSVVGNAVDAHTLEHASHLFHFFACGAVDNGGPIKVPFLVNGRAARLLTEEGAKVKMTAGFFADRQVQVETVKAGVGMQRVL